MLVGFSVALIKHKDQKQLEEEKGLFISHSRPIVKGAKAGTSSSLWQAQAGATGECCLQLAPSMLLLILPRTRDGTSQRGALPHPSLIKKMPHRRASVRDVFSVEVPPPSVILACARLISHTSTLHKSKCLLNF